MLLRKVVIAKMYLYKQDHHTQRHELDLDSEACTRITSSLADHQFISSQFAFPNSLEAIVTWSTWLHPPSRWRNSKCFIVAKVRDRVPVAPRKKTVDWSIYR
ncbi:uncharacterized protein LOC123327268 [Drosophila simulans]|uniref:uncharacterized protein LOC123327268 n=1 Tax=Drosophila simulans TaxID=7240 RepID=UPI001D102DF2|nr:uncharacterized protein LOC123327268 [Drosophila simulans]